MQNGGASRLQYRWHVDPFVRSVLNVHLNVFNERAVHAASSWYTVARLALHFLKLVISKLRLLCAQSLLPTHSIDD